MVVTAGGVGPGAGVTDGAAPPVPPGTAGAGADGISPVGGVGVTDGVVPGTAGAGVVGAAPDGGAAVPGDGAVVTVSLVPPDTDGVTADGAVTVGGVGAAGTAVPEGGVVVTPSVLGAVVVTDGGVVTVGAAVDGVVSVDEFVSAWAIMNAPTGRTVELPNSPKSTAVWQSVSKTRSWPTFWNSPEYEKPTCAHIDISAITRILDSVMPRILFTNESLLPQFALQIVQGV